MAATPDGALIINAAPTGNELVEMWRGNMLIAYPISSLRAGYPASTVRGVTPSGALIQSGSPTGEEVIVTWINGNCRVAYQLRTLSGNPPAVVGKFFTPDGVQIITSAPTGFELIEAWSGNTRVAFSEANVLPVLQRIVVGNQNNVMNQLLALQRSFNGRERKWTGMTGARRLRARYPTYYYNSSGVPTKISANYSAATSIEYPPGSGNFYRFSKGGLFTMTIDVSDAYGESDDLPALEIPAMTAFDVVFWFDGPSAVLPRTGRGNPAYDLGANSATTLGDPTNGGAPYAAMTARSGATMKPTITGDAITPTRMFFISGDSHGYSSNGTIDNASNTPFIEKILNPLWPVFNTSLAGRRADAIAVPGRMDFDLAFMGGIDLTDNINCLGTNDILAGFNATLISNDHVTAAGYMNAAFPSVVNYSNSILPLTSGTFTTLDGQTLRNSGALEPNRLTFNSGRAAGTNCGGVAGFDPATVAETPNTALELVFKVDGGPWTDDGTHPVTLGHTGIAAGCVSQRVAMFGQ